VQPQLSVEEQYRRARRDEFKRLQDRDLAQEEKQHLGVIRLAQLSYDWKLKVVFVVTLLMVATVYYLYCVVHADRFVLNRSIYSTQQLCKEYTEERQSAQRVLIECDQRKVAEAEYDHQFHSDVAAVFVLEDTDSRTHLDKLPNGTPVFMFTSGAANTLSDPVWHVEASEGAIQLRRQWRTCVLSQIVDCKLVPRPGSRVSQRECTAAERQLQNSAELANNRLDTEQYIRANCVCVRGTLRKIVSMTTEVRTYSIPLSTSFSLSFIVTVATKQRAHG